MVVVEDVDITTTIIVIVVIIIITTIMVISMGIVIPPADHHRSIQVHVGIIITKEMVDMVVVVAAVAVDTTKEIPILHR